MALRDEEHLIVRWLSQYGPMTKIMIKSLIHYKPFETVNRILGGLVRYRKITLIENRKYYATDRFCKVIPRMQKAVWVLIQFARTIDPRCHQIADSPSQIRFVKDKMVYEIIVLNRDDDYLTRLLHPEKNKTFIIVVPDMNFAEKLWLPEAPCIFATVTPTDREEPKVEFYSA